MTDPSAGPCIPIPYSQQYMLEQGGQPAARVLQVGMGSLCGRSEKGQPDRTGSRKQSCRLGKERGMEWHSGRVRGWFVACLPNRLAPTELEDDKYLTHYSWTLWTGKMSLTTPYRQSNYTKQLLEVIKPSPSFHLISYSVTPHNRHLNVQWQLCKRNNYGIRS